MNRTLTLFTGLISTMCTVAIANGISMDNDAARVTSAKISLAQAITVAEQRVSGKASRAEFDHSLHGDVYEVEVLAGPKVFDVKVDAENGTIISSVEDQPDRDEDQED